MKLFVSSYKNDLGWYVPQPIKDFIEMVDFEYEEIRFHLNISTKLVCLDSDEEKNTSTNDVFSQ